MSYAPLGNPARMAHCLYSGSVKDVYGVQGESPYIFHFSDRYSIFDWGEMPDSLVGKGAALATMGDLFFRRLGLAESWLNWNIPDKYPKFFRDGLSSSSLWSALRRNGLSHHSLGLVDDRLVPVPLGLSSNRLAVRALQRPPAPALVSEGKLSYDYSAYQKKPDDCLVPLEVVFRFGAPEGSSFLQRLERNPKYGEEFGFSETPIAGELFSYPIVEFFTKLEPTDRFLPRQEAAQIAGLSSEELDTLTALTLLISLRLKDWFSAVGLELWDGKFEFAFLPGNSGRGFQLVDSIGPDELRLMGHGDVHFSKEFLRRVYRGSEWYVAAERAKVLAKERAVTDWKAICRNELGQTPKALPKEALLCASQLYTSLANDLAKSANEPIPFFGSPTVRELCDKMQGLHP